MSKKIDWRKIYNILCLDCTSYIGDGEQLKQARKHARENKHELRYLADVTVHEDYREVKDGKE